MTYTFPAKFSFFEMLALARRGEFDPMAFQGQIELDFPQTFDKGRFHHFVKELLNGFDESKAAPMAVPDAFAPHVRSCSRLGTYESPD